MSQMAAEAPPAAPARPAPARRENVFTRKLGPIPTWGWVLIAVGLIGVYYLWHRNTQTQTATGTNASQVPQFVNQVYTSGTPPTAPAPAQTPTCPKGQAWDPDSQKCIPEHRVKRKHPRKHKGRDMQSPEAPAAGTAVQGAQGTIVPATGQGIGVFQQYVPPTGG